jgi:GH24 family phage-related lysozyme (muramidase)
MPNIIGNSIRTWVADQINIRQKFHGAGDPPNFRTMENLSYLNSKTSWIKLGSGAYVTSDRLVAEGLDISFTGNELAKNHVLFGGTSRADITNNSIIQRGSLDSSVSNIWGNREGVYNVNASANVSTSTTGEFGLVPMPGIESAEIKCLNRGSIKKATVKIKCYGPEQFKIIDLLYLRLGYTVLLEWGNSLFINNSGELRKPDYTLLEGSGGIFNNTKWEGSSYLSFLPLIDAGRKNYSGNYDGLLAKVTNFSWTFNQDGSYDIDLSLISLGDVVESLKLNMPPPYGIEKFINTAYILYNGDNTQATSDANVLPTPADNIISSYLFLQKLYLDKEVNNNSGQLTSEERKYANDVYFTINNSNLQGGTSNPYVGGTFITPPSGAVIELGVQQAVSPRFDEFSEAEAWVDANYPGEKTIRWGSYTGYAKRDAAANKATYVDIIGDLDIGWGAALGGYYYHAYVYYYPQFNVDTNQTSYDVVYLNYNEGKDWVKVNDKGFYMRFGHLLQFIQDKVLPQVKDSNTNQLGKQASILNIEYGIWNSKMYTLPYQVSFDPRVCIVRGGEIIGSDVLRKEFFATLAQFQDIENGFAYTMNIYVNHMQILSSLDGNKDEEGNINIFGFLSDICNALNKALGGINKLEPVIEEENNTLYIIDASYSEPIKSNYTLELYGYNPNKANQSTFVRNFDLKTEITNDFATTVTIGATAGGYTKGTENTMFSKWNKGIKDIFKPEYVAAVEESRLKDNPEEDEARKMYIEGFWNQGLSAFGLTLNDVDEYGDWYNYAAGLSDEIIDKNINVATEFYKYVQYRIQQENEKYASPANGFIPINLGITMDGLSGIKIYDAINVSTRFLPSNYPDNLKFIIKGVNHKLSKNDWETTLETVVIPKNEDENGALRVPYSTIKDIVTNKIIGQPTLESFGRALSAIYNAATAASGGGGGSGGGSGGTTVPVLNVADLKPWSRKIKRETSGDTWEAEAANFIALKEGFTKTAGWDENHYRGGYGSDKILKADGKLYTCVKGTPFTKQEAIDTLRTYSIYEYSAPIIKAIGQGNWDKLNKHQKTALVSLTYNAGIYIWSEAKYKYAQRIAAAIKKGDYQAAAQGILDGPKTASGEYYASLARRRTEEAQLFLLDASKSIYKN